MDLISPQERSVFNEALRDIHDTFSRDIVVTKTIKTPQANLANANDDYDFTQNYNVGTEEFTYSYISSTIKARIKYVDRQDKEFSLLNEVNVAMDLGVLRIKVAKADCEVVTESSNILVDGHNTRVLFRDKPHGLFDADYCTFYLQRVV